jgi:hypothetical protein
MTSIPMFDPDEYSTDSPDASTSGSTSSDTGLSQTEIRDAVGSIDTIETSIDPDSGRATQTIVSPTDTVTDTGQTEDNITTTETGGTETIEDLRDDEQANEDATDGAAFGDPDVVETIDEDTSWTIAGESSDSDESESSVPEGGGDIPTWVWGVGAAGLVGVAAMRRS